VNAATIVRTVRPARRVAGAVRVPGDKSISHRALLFGALATGTTEIRNLLASDDVLATESALAALGVPTDRSAADVVRITGRPLRASATPLDCANSGTTMRTFMGVLAGAGIGATLVGDASLSKRPMARVYEPLRAMGARIDASPEKTAPIVVHAGAALTGIDYTLPVASAQVKTAILLAGLRAAGRTTVRGKIASRDHTERLLPHFGVRLDATPEAIALDGGQTLRAARVDVPGDPSAAAFWFAAAALVPGASVTVTDVSLNPTRLGFLEILRAMGASVAVHLRASEPEPAGDVTVAYAPLTGVTVDGDLVAAAIDELPLVAVLATQARGTTTVADAEELRVKESDRIATVAANLRAMGASVDERRDGFRIEGAQPLSGARVHSFGDHRLAMAFAVAALAADGPTTIEGAEAVAISYPHFFDDLERLSQ
jgi:3-phosphoshikimate 1-carboxyvinyltransferase